MPDRATQLLRSNQNQDGGWGHVAGTRSTTEATAHAVMGLRLLGQGEAPAVARGLAWLGDRQREDGSWPASDAVPASSWMTSSAVLVLRDAGHRQRAVAGARWLLGQEGRFEEGLLERLGRLLGRRRLGGNDFSLQGWPWTAGTVSWVEPTAAALLALKSLRPALPRRAAADRVEEAEAMLFDRACVGGGWNYGNTRVLDEELPPYPDTTAWALLALQDHRDHPVVRQGIAAQRRMLAENDSGLTVALSILAFGAHGVPVGDLPDRLRRNLAATDLLGETRPLALAALALSGGRTPFHLDP